MTYDDFTTATTVVPTVWSLVGWTKYVVLPILAELHDLESVEHVLWLRGITVKEIYNRLPSACEQMLTQGDVRLTVAINIR